MRRLAILLLLIAGTVAADTLVITRAGYFLLRQDAAGVPSLTKIEQVIKLDEPTNPNPTPTPVPTNPLEIHRAAVQAATDRVTDPNKTNAKKALAELYRTAAGLPVTNTLQLRQATDAIYGALSLTQWTAWKAEVDRSAASFGVLEDAKKAWIVTAEVLEKP